MKRLGWFLFISFVCIGGDAFTQKRQISLEDIFQSGIFYTEDQVEFNFSKDGKSLYEIAGNTLTKKSIDNLDRKIILIRPEQMMWDGGNVLSLDHIEFSPSERKIFIFQNRKNIYRRSFSSTVFIYDLETKKIQRISEKPIMYPSFSPDETKVAYILDKDIWVYDLATRKSKRVTMSGGKGKSILNGFSDWVYEEEFELTKAYEWSMDSKNIAYISMDEGQVPDYVLQYFINGDEYPTDYHYKYPKAGRDNSLISLNVVDISTLENKSLSIFQDETGNTNSDIYIPKLWYTPDNRICAMRMNRLQNKMDILLYPTSETQPKIIYKEEDKFYIDLSNFYVRFIATGKKFLITSEREGHNQLYIFDVEKGLEKKLTHEKNDIDKIYAYDDKKGIVYYTAAFPTPMDRNLFQVDTKGKVTAITEGYGWNDAQFNATADYYILTYSNPSTPPVSTLFSTKKKYSRTLADNKSLKNVMQFYGFVKPEYIQVKNRSGVELNVSVMRPNDSLAMFKQYPVLFYNYGGPGSQQVTHQYISNAWKQMMCQKGYIIVTCDNTGTGFRGADFKKRTYLQLGKMEIDDQIDVAKFMANQPYVDDKRIGHFGWSFGGFMSALAITKGADIFSSAVAVAPVTNWKYYDNIYTERFMRKPIENGEGYEENSPMNYVHQMKGNFLIIHGTADDNVHVQNTYNMVEAMVQQNKQFDMMIYPDKNHGIYGGNTTYHLWTHITNWLLQNL